MPKPNHVDLSLKEPAETVNRRAERHPADEVEAGGRWFPGRRSLIRVLIGATLGTTVGYMAEAAAWGGLIGFWVGMIATFDVREGRLFFDREEFSVTWGKEGWRRGMQELQENFIGGANLLRQTARILLGYRDHFELEHHWWHRLWKVGIVVSSCVLFLTIFIDEARQYPPGSTVPSIFVQA